MTLPLGFTLTADFTGKGWLFLAVLMALSLLLFLANHRRSQIDGVSRAGIRLIVLLRLLAIMLILLLVFDPHLNLSRSRTHSKRIAVLLDHSASMSQAWDGSVASLVQAEEAVIADLKTSYSVDLWSLDGKALSGAGQPFADQQTIFGWTPGMGRRAEDLSDVYAAVFMITDGHLNGGRSPLDQAWSEALPIHPILPLKPGVNQSLKVLDVSTAKNPDLMNQLDVLVKLQQAGLQGRQLNLDLKAGSSTIASISQVLSPTFLDLRLPVKMILDRDQKVTAVFRVSGTDIQLETEIWIPAERKKSQVLLVSERVNPLHKFLNLSYPDSLYELHTRVATFAGVEQPLEALDGIQLDLIILDQITEAYKDPEILRIIVDAVKRRCPVIIFLDNQTPLNQELSAIFGLAYSDQRALSGDFSLEWGRDAAEHPFYLGLLGKGIRQSDLLNVAPIRRAQYSVSAPGTRIWDLGLGANSTPALILSDKPVQAVFSGGEYWKLFFNPQNSPFMLAMWSYLNHYLQEIADFKAVTIQSFMATASTGSLVPLEIQIRDVDGSPIRNAELRVWQEGPSGEALNLELTDTRPGTYAVQLQTQRSGAQKVIAEAYRFGELWGQDTSMIELMAFSGENQSKGVDVSFLSRLAQRSGGQLIQLGENELPVIPRQMYQSVYNYRWNGLRSSIWFILLVLLLSAEWIIRRRQGLL